jgi:hypothetical protein
LTARVLSAPGANHKETLKKEITLRFGERKTLQQRLLIRK